MDGVAVVRRDFRPGAAGLQDGLNAIGGLIVVNMRDVRILSWARRAMWEASLPVDAGPTQIALAIYRKQREDMVFAQDPIYTELYTSAVKLLCLDPDGECLRGGDCDDNVIVLAAALMSVGIPVRLLVRSYPGMELLHLMIQYDADPLKRGQWTCFDATSPNGACFPGYSSEMVASLEVEPMVREQPPQMMILGRPPIFGSGRLFDLSMFGAPPAASSSSSTSTSSSSAPATLTQEQSDAWAALLAEGKQRLDHSIERILWTSGQLAAVRSDLGMPQNDPPPASSSDVPAGLSPIQAYGQTFQWTAAVQNAEQKLIQTATFASGVLADALAGKRALYFQDGDLFVAAMDGDAYGVLMKPSAGPGSPLVPDYVDLSKGQATTGQVGYGIAPIIIGIGIVAVSLAAVYAVTKIVDYLSSAHRDDMVGKGAAAQQELVTSGKQTPEQAAAFMNATKDTLAAPPPGAASSGISLWALVAAVLGGALLGVVGVEVVPKLLSARLSFAPATA
jgi:hypothetical protein